MAGHPHRAAASPEQPSLFRGALNFDHELRHELRLAIAACGLSRRQIAERMSDLTASHITEAMLNAWTAPSRARWQLPVRYSVAFDVATGGERILHFLARKMDRAVLSPAEALHAELGALALREAEIKRRRRDVLSQLESQPRRA